MQLINSSVLSPKATQMNNRAGEITLRLMEFLIVFFSVDNLKSIVINVLSKVTNVHVTADNIEECHGIEKSKGNSNKTIARFINRKHCICALVNRKKLKSFNGESIGLPSVKLYFNENSTVYNNTLVFYGCKLRHAGVVNRAHTLNGNLHILRMLVKGLSRFFI